MDKSESIKELISATIKVMAEVKGIDKTMVIGTGNNAYKGVPDQEVKKIVGESMVKNGLAIYPINIEEDCKIDAWDEVSTQYGTKRKQQVFTRVRVTYMLCHESGEYIILKGIGHGVDSQDKSAGKAMTYALKYQLLYTFLIPTGKIDDADTVHSDDIKTVPNNPEPSKKPAPVQTIPQLLEEASEKVRSAKTTAELNSTYKFYPELEKNSVFINLLKERKNKLSQNKQHERINNF